MYDFALSPPTISIYFERINFNLPDTQAIVMPPNSLSENLNKNVPHGREDNISSACFLRTNPIIVLKKKGERETFKNHFFFNIWRFSINQIIFKSRYPICTSIQKTYPSAHGPLKCSLVSFMMA